MNNYDDQVLGTQNPLHPANQVTVLDDAVEQMTELQFAEYERNLYQNRAYFLNQKLENIKTLCDGMSEDNGLALLILKLIEK